MKNLKQSIKQQQELLTKTLGMSLQNLAGKLSPVINSQLLLNEHLSSACKELSFCKNLYALDSQGVQISSTMNREKIEHDAYGRNRSNRPYMKNMFGEKEFKLSDSYISKNKKRPLINSYPSD
ncbi:hypothetical protein [Bathymodiolus septemdierum thioautotrophic gill symbiont]|uniref:hypothetical protein n=1 Tax=Bathymodiolus septemdierum thioautotrophic gill symbiont TaxID=113267 RepID=UPI0008245670|nr:hypothetical protein [Bathymodiolus septemdierum thioautotrophic gill symbiont]